MKRICIFPLDRGWFSFVFSPATLLFLYGSLPYVCFTISLSSCCCSDSDGIRPFTPGHRAEFFFDLLGDSFSSFRVDLISRPRPLSRTLLIKNVGGKKPN